MKLVSPLISFHMRQRMSRIQWFIDNPFEAQELVFQDLIVKAATTEWGKNYRFDELNSQGSFKERIPLQDYESLKPFIQRSMRGERDVLWPGRTKWFAKSSGTTSDRSKFIPITNESLHDCHYQSGRDVMTLYLENFPNKNVFAGKGMVMGGSHSISAVNEDSICGDLSAILMQNMPIIGEIYRVPKLEVALLDDWEEKAEMLVKSTIGENLTNISGVPSWTLVYLRNALEATGKRDIAEIWPNLELFMHGGVNFQPYRTAFEAINPSGTLSYQEVYNASEGFIGIQDRPDKDDMLLLLDNGIYYEFIPKSEWGKENPRTKSLDEVEMDEIYALVISTNSGLWRYQIGDTIRFTDLNPHRIKIEGRTKHFINVFGEELMVANTDSALSKVCPLHDCEVRDYTVAPIFMKESDSGGHEWLIEFGKEPSDMSQFIIDLDKELQSVNSDYAAKRSYDAAIKLPVVHSIPSGSFEKWLKMKGKLGGQNKVPRLSNERKYLEEIQSMLIN